MDPDVPYVYMTWPCPYTKLHPSFPCAPSTLSIVIPAFNEALRLPSTLTSLFKYVQHQPWFQTIELIVVDDGSTDGTCAVALATFPFAPSCVVRPQVVQLKSNLGKGAAVKVGMMMTQGLFVLFVDADGATPFHELDPLVRAIQDIAIGSRAHLVKREAVVNRSWIRNLLMHLFHGIVMVLGLTHVQDTQCGFKLFRRSVAQTLFPHLHVHGWIFDIEVLLVASWLNYHVVEIPVQWKEMEGSKLNIARDSIRMLLDLVKVRWNYYLGRWKVPYEAQFKNEALYQLEKSTFTSTSTSTSSSSLVSDQRPPDTLLRLKKNEKKKKKKLHT
ncbi:dolichyl-phosphate beta-glucosyltransferase [Coelomomyces lativittatus]|nr:dolichyl-phosphate beta-glucosyltransferase [Coelomomyces lativittatus]